ncbi:MAG: PAC2 family protein [Candidatus Omnitrophica bacterium]|nr:PAC2 family protein [Candidatus Omnitrophota bacterium]
MERIKIFKRPKLKSPYLIVAWPGMGEVAYKSAAYLVEKLKAEKFASLLPEDFFYLTGSVIEKGLLTLPEMPASNFYYWKNPGARTQGALKDFLGKPAKNDLIIFLSDAQPDLSKADTYCKEIISFAKAQGVKLVFGFAAMPQPIDHLQPAGVWFTATTPELNNNLKKYNLKLMPEGQISGMNGLFLGFAKKEGLKGICLLGEIPLYTIQIENPKAVHSVLEALTKILNLKIDFGDLIERERILEEEINQLMDYLKLGPQVQVGPIQEEDIERIKKSLSELSKLPISVKEKIEKLFAQAKSDISKAKELKAELDRWSAYKEYEDRFLDLFKKAKDKDN